MESLEDITDSLIWKVIEGLKLKDADAEKTFLDDDSELVLLNFTYNKIPIIEGNKMTNRIIRLYLPNSVKTGDVCLIVGDGKSKNNRTRESIDENINMWYDRLRKIGITQISEVIPHLKLRLEYSSYETRRHLLSRYETFLADEKIVRFLPETLGKVFYKIKRKIPLQVKLDRGDLKNQLQRALNTTVCNLSATGSMSSVPVAKVSMSKTEAVKNVRYAIDKIMEEIPGGKKNINSLHLQLKGGKSFPLFQCSEEASVAVEVPILKQAVKYEPLIEEVSTVKGKVSVAPDGTITIYRDGRSWILGSEGRKHKLPKSQSKNKSKKQKLEPKTKAVGGQTNANAKGSKNEALKTGQKDKPADKKAAGEQEPSETEMIDEEDLSDLEFSSDADSEAGDESDSLDEGEGGEGDTRNGADEDNSKEESEENEMDDDSLSEEGDQDMTEDDEDDPEFDAEDIPKIPPPQPKRSQLGNKNKNPKLSPVVKGKPNATRKVKTPVKTPNTARKMKKSGPMASKQAISKVAAIRSKPSDQVKKSGQKKLKA